MPSPFLTFENGNFIFVKDGYKKSQVSIRAAVNEFRRYADDTAERILKKVFVKRYTSPLVPQPIFDKLDEHQITGINWQLSRSRSYLAHAPGAGKTAEAIIASLLCPFPGQTVFIVPPDLTVNWEREIHIWTEWTGKWPSIAIVPVSEHQERLDWRADFIIVPDSMLAKAWVQTALLGIKIKYLSVDEASRFKEIGSTRTLALFGGNEFPGLIRRAPISVLLDGSPMPNRPMELWAPTYAMSPESIDFMNQEEFGFKYCGARQNDFGRWEFKGESNTDELKSRLQKSFMHVVTEEELEHPERRRAILMMSEDPRTAQIKSWEKKHLHRMDFSNITEDTNLGELAKIRQELGLTKVDWAIKYVRRLLEDKNEFILLFAWHREVIERLCVGLSKYAPVPILGGTKAAVRESLFKSFQDGHSQLIAGNISAIGRGHNLPRASRAVFVEWSWTDENNKQCEKRASRKGSTRDFVRCDYLVAPGSLDEKVLSSVFRKASTTRKVIG